MMSEMHIRKVKALDDRAKRKAEKMGLDKDDLVLVETIIQEMRPPKYELTEIEGSPTEYLKSKMDENRRFEDE